jgi:hypothetical protein
METCEPLSPCFEGGCQYSLRLLIPEHLFIELYHSHILLG